MRKARLMAVLIVCAAVAGIGAVPASADGGRLPRDRSFETPVVDGYQTFGSQTSLNCAPTVTQVTYGCWGVGSGNVGLVNGDYSADGFSFHAPSGQQWVNLAGDGSGGTTTSLAQTVGLTVGAKYTLTFSVGNVGAGYQSRTMVLFNFAPVTIALSSKGAHSSVMLWKKFSYTFTANAQRVTITFQNNEPADEKWNGLDKILLTRVD